MKISCKKQPTVKRRKKDACTGHTPSHTTAPPRKKTSPASIKFYGSDIWNANISMKPSHGPNGPATVSKSMYALMLILPRRV